MEAALVYLAVILRRNDGGLRAKAVRAGLAVGPLDGARVSAHAAGQRLRGGMGQVAARAAAHLPP